MSERNGGHRVPRLAELLFTLVTPRRERHFVLGDVREEFVRILESGKSLRAARLWYWRQLLGSARPGCRRLVKAKMLSNGPRRRGMVDRQWYDLRLATRALVRRPLLSATAVVTLAVGIGATVAMYSIVHGVLLARLGYAEPERVVCLFSLRGNMGGEPSAFSYADFEDLRDLTRAFSEVAATGVWNPTAIVDGDPWKVNGQSVSGNFFDVLGVNAALGRTFLPEEDVLGHEPVVVLSYETWQSRFGGDSSVVGRSVNLSGVLYTIVGVAPPKLEVPRGKPDMWQARPEYFSKERMPRGSHNVWPIARIAPGVTMEQVEADLTEIAIRLEPLHPAHAGQRFAATPVHEVLVGSVRPALLVLFAAVALVLLIACANVANLLLSSATGRSHEIAVKGALGASRGRLVHQLLLESLLMALLAGAIGVLIALACTSLFEAIGVAQLPRSAMVSINGPIVAFALVISVFTAVVFGLVPALRACGEDVGVRLQEGGRSRSATRRQMGAQRVLVVAEVAVSVLLLTGAGLLLKSYANLTNVDAGFATENLLTFRLNPSRQRYQSDAELTRYYEAVVQNLTALPGVSSAGAVSALPLTGAWDGEIVLRPDKPVPDPATNPHVEARAVTPDYFETLGIELIRGRLFTTADNESAPDVAIVSDGLARRLFPGEDPIGKFVTVSNQRPCAIVGVVADVNNFGLEENAEPTVYVPHAQHILPWIRRTMAVALKTSLDQAVLTAPVRRAVWDVDPTVAIADFRSMDRIIADDISGPRLGMSLLTSFAGLAILLALIGVSSVMAYAVSQRRSEIGTRLALGAQSRDVVGMVIKDGARTVVLGLAVGVLGALLLGRAIQSMLFLVEPRDPAVLLLVSVLLAVFAFFAMWVPAAQASRVPPVEVLKQM